MSDPKPYLQPVDDGLPMRSSQPYALYKLGALRHYLLQANAVMNKHPWRAKCYIDLQAGPGKNRIGNSVELGSPLIALTTSAANRFIFNEYNEKEPELYGALVERVSASPQGQVTVLQQDLNQAVDKVCEEIRLRDSTFIKDVFSTFSIAFLDPEGLELRWETVGKLAQMKKMDLIINFSTQGLKRNIEAGHHQIVDNFFGTSEWLDVYNRTRPTLVRQALIEFYRQNLKQFGYNVDIDPELGGQYVTANNSKNVEVYSMIFASKDELGNKFWRQSAKAVQPQKNLPGLE